MLRAAPLVAAACLALALPLTTPVAEASHEWRHVYHYVEVGFLIEWCVIDSGQTGLVPFREDSRIYCQYQH